MAQGAAQSPVIDEFLGPVWAEHHEKMLDFGSLLGGLARGIHNKLPKPAKGKSMMTGVLEGQTVVVVGGSSGIGEAVAELAYHEGARVFAVSRSGRAPEGAIGVAASVEMPPRLRA